MNQYVFSPKPSIHGYLLVCILIMGFMIGCSAGEIPLAQEEDSVETAFVTMTPEPTALAILVATTSTATATVTTEPAGTALVVPTITPSPTPTIAPSKAPTPVPTLLPLEREAVFENFMATNGGCELPCWWGFRLGDSLESISQTFIDLGIAPLSIEDSWQVASDRMGTRSAYYADYYEDDQYGIAANDRLSIRMEFHELDGNVQYIYVNVNRVKFEKSEEEFIRDWEQYFLSSFLQRYGKPTQVYFRIRSVGDLMIPPQYSVSLLYRETGLAITYHIEGVWLDEIYTQAEVCLDVKNVVAVELSLFDPDGFDRWGYQFAPYHDELYEPLTWEREIGMSLDAFYDTYRFPENLNCVFTGQ